MKTSKKLFIGLFSSVALSLCVGIGVNQTFTPTYAVEPETTTVPAEPEKKPIDYAKMAWEKIAPYLITFLSAEGISVLTNVSLYLMKKKKEKKTNENVEEMVKSNSEIDKKMDESIIELNKSAIENRQLLDECLTEIRNLTNANKKLASELNEVKTLKKTVKMLLTIVGKSILLDENAINNGLAKEVAELLEENIR